MCPAKERFNVAEVARGEFRRFTVGDVNTSERFGLMYCLYFLLELFYLLNYIHVSLCQDSYYRCRYS